MTVLSTWLHVALMSDNKLSWTSRIMFKSVDKDTFPEADQSDDQTRPHLDLGSLQWVNKLSDCLSHFYQKNNDAKLGNLESTWLALINRGQHLESIN